MTASVDDLDQTVSLYPLVYLDEGDQVTVGRSDIDSYAVLEPDGAELIRRLADGMTIRAAAQWYADTYGEPVDIVELIAGLTELELVRPDGVALAAAPAPVRWQGLGRLAFSRPAVVLYAAIVVAWIVAAATRSGLAPSYHQLFFSRYFSIIEVVLFFGQFPLMLIHEAAHALAGRRLGLNSRLRLSHRLYFLVLETSMDGLVSVPRRKRYLPMLAGIGADLVITALLGLFALALRTDDGSFPVAARIALALAFTTLLRVIWQFYFYLQTDIYVLVSMVLGCVSLHAAAQKVMRDRFARLIHRPAWRVDLSTLHPNDRKAARWYSWLFVAGYAATILIGLFAILPTAVKFLSGVLGRFGGGASVGGLIDSTVFVVLNVGQLVLVGYLSRRRRRERGPDLTHVLGE